VMIYVYFIKHRLPKLWSEKLNSSPESLISVLFGSNGPLQNKLALDCDQMFCFHFA
jgi:hypothetical protein